MTRSKYPSGGDGLPLAALFRLNVGRSLTFDDLIILPRYVEGQVYQALLESIASEHGARMTAMSSATDNAAKMIGTLTLFINRARQAGITGVISKAQGLDNVIATLARLMNGPVQDRGPMHLTGVAARRVSRTRERSISDLTPREREVLRLLSLGHGTGTLALSLGVSYSTARTHIQNVLAKLEVHSRLEAVALLHQQYGAVGSRHLSPEPRERAEPSRPKERRIV